MLDRLRVHFRKRGEWYWAPFLYGLCVCILYYPIFGGEQGFGWDTIESYWPDLAYFSKQLSSGEWPLWNPYDRGGYPFFADPQASLMYPVQWLFAAAGAAMGDVPWWLIQLKMLAHHVLAGSLMYAYLRSRGIERSASLIGGIALIASTPWLIHKASNILLPLAWVPLIWIAIDKLVTKPSARAALLLAGAIYLAGSAGSPPGFFYALLLSSSYGVFRATSELLRRRRAGVLGPYGGRLFVHLGVAALVTVLMLLVIVIPTLDLTDLSLRSKRTLDYALSMPLPAKDTLLGLVAPAAKKMDAYMGMVPVILALVAVVLRPNRDRRAGIFMLAASLFFLVLSFGKATPLLGWFVEHVPGFDLFRIASRYKLLYAVAMAAAAGYGASAVLRLGAKRLSNDDLRLLGPVLFLAALSVVLAIKLDAANPKARAPADSIWIAALAAFAVIGAGWHKRRQAAWVLVATSLLVIYDADHFWHWRGKIFEARVDHKEDLARLENLPGAGSRLRIYDEYQLEQRAGARLGVRDFRGYPSGDPLDLRRYRQILGQIDSRPELLAAFNVGYVLTGRHSRNGTRRNYLRRRPSQRRPKLFVAAGSVDVTRYPTPQVAWYNTILTIDRRSAIQALSVQAQRHPDERIAIIEPDQAQRLGSARESLEEGKTLLSGPGEVASFEADRIVVTVKPPRTSLVVLNELSYPGWTPYVDGKKAPALTANYLLRAVVVEAGAHIIEWRFEPKGYPWLLACWLLSLLAVLLACLGPSPRRWLERREPG